MTTIEGVEMWANPEGMILWMSDWAKCADFGRRGLIRVVHHHDGFNTTVYYIK